MKFIASFFYLLISTSTFASAAIVCDHFDNDGVCSNKENLYIRGADQLEAWDACPTGTHLPTAREFAKEAQGFGAKGILEVNQVPAGSPPNLDYGYQLFSVLNPDGSKDEFYFSHEGYQRPKSKFDDENFWSSSIIISSTNADTALSFNYRQGGFYSYPWRGTSNSSNDTRCIPGAVPSSDHLDYNRILRDKFNNLRVGYDQNKAAASCPTGYHLPTVRELAKLSQSIGGAKGVLEVNQVDPNSVPKGYEKISAMNSDGIKDEFYYSKEGYTPPDDRVLGFFWSSSMSTALNETFPKCKSHPEYNFAFILDGRHSSGDLLAYSCDFTLQTVVQCIPN